MIHNPAPRIAWRYLRAKKSHSAVGAISIISICGMAVATAAIVCVLSVFNGFRGMLGEKLDTMVADITVTPSAGKTFVNADSLATVIRGIEGVSAVMPTVTDNALMLYEAREMPILLKGVDQSAYPEIIAIDSIMLDGYRFPRESRAEDDFDSPAVGAVSIGVGSRLGLYSGGTAMIFAPKREGRINTANPVSSFVVDSLRVGGVFQSRQNQFDENLVICDYATARDLFQYDTEATSFEIKAMPGTDTGLLAERIASRLGTGASVRDRFRMQEINFRMVKIEKWVSFMLLFLILIIASFNIISSLSMLVLEKQNSLHTLAALGMSRRHIGSIFAWESIYVALIGGTGGIALGVILCLLQQHFGFLKLSGDASSLIMSTYPVAVEPADLAVTLVPVLVIGLATALITDRFACSLLKQGARA